MSVHRADTPTGEAPPPFDDPPPKHRKCYRHDLHFSHAACDPMCRNPARYFEELRKDTAQWGSCSC